ncbi:leucine-rich repeat domain-containing protein [Candidatus Dependentiae bacterium]|nr:leucine-rich repeat domain-containing protein [Candidatus Dependentiae bacterium]
MMKFVRLFLNSLVLTTLALSMSLQANISPLAFKEIFEHFKPGYELYAPNIGCAALKNGTVDAIRFYNVIPGPQDSQGRRLYIQDKALKNDPFAALAILLFPSPAGQLTAMTSHSQSIGAQLSVQDVATLLNFCAKVRAAVKNGKAHDKTGNEFGKNIRNILKTCSQSCQDQDKNYFVNFIENNKQFAPEGYPHSQDLLVSLCKCIELEERDDRRQKKCATYKDQEKFKRHFEKYHEATFYPKYTPEMLLNAFFCLKFGSEEIQTLIQNLDEQLVDHQVMFENGLIDANNLKAAVQKSSDQATLDDLWVIQNRDLIDAVIPYARQCKPVNNGLACGYDRATNQLLENKKYPDCTETTIRHLCNLALYNKQTKHWDVEHALKKISDMQTHDNLEAFYQLQKPEQANSGEAAVRNAWSKVVNNLDANIRYNQKYLAQSNHNDNEVDTGLVNIMRVLNTVFNLGLESEPMYQDDNQYAQAVTEWATTGLKTFFKTLAPEKQNISIEIDNVATYTASDNRKDCSAKVTVQVEQDFNFVMGVEFDHAKFDSITTLAPERVQVSQDKTASCAQYHAHTLQHSGEQILLLSAATKNFITTPLHTLFSINVIDSATIITMLKQLHVMLTGNHINYARAALILQNALQRFLWQDLQISSNIQPVLRNLYDLNNDEIRSVLSKEVKTIIGDKWLSDFFNNSFDDASQFFTALEAIDLSSSGIKALEISGTCPNLKKLNLSNTQNLESVKLSGSLNELEEITLSDSEIKTIEISENVCPNLKKLNLYNTQNLESVTLSGSLNALKTIDLSKSRIQSLEISGNTRPNLKNLYLYKTQNLESLTLSGSLNALKTIDLGFSGIRTLEISGTCPNLKKLYLFEIPNLKSVTLSGSLNQLETIDLDCSRIRTLEISGTCPNLKKLYLSHTPNIESLTLSGSFNALEEITLWGSGVKELVLDKNLFPKLKTYDPRIKFIDKKRKRDEEDNFEEEIGKENKHFKFVEIEDAELIEIKETNLIEVEASERNNTNNEIADQQINWCNLI